MGEELQVRSFTLCANASMVISSVLPTFMTRRRNDPCHEADESFDSVTHIAEATRLLAAAVDTDGRVVQRRLDEIRQHHSVATRFAGDPQY